MQNINTVKPSNAIAPAQPNPLADLLSLESRNKKSFLSLIKFITSNSKDANINDVFYSVSNDYTVSKKSEQMAKIFTPESIAYTLISQYTYYSLSDLQYFIEHLKIDLTQVVYPEIITIDAKKWPPTIEAGKIIEGTKNDIFTALHNAGATITKKLDEAQWIGQHLFVSNYHGASEDKDGAKIKYLIQETKKQFIEKNIDIEPFITKALQTNSSYFIALFKAQNIELNTFMQQELSYDVNQFFVDRPLFFYANTEPQIDYIIEQGANFELKNNKKQNYIESWAESSEGKTVLTYLNSKSSKDVDLNSVVINFFKNDRKLGELKSIVSQLAKSLKIKDKKTILIEGNTLFYNALRHKHWKYAYSLCEAFEKEEDFLKSAANEFNSLGVPPFLYLLADKTSSYESRDKNGTKRVALLEKTLSNFNFTEHKNNPSFIKKLTKTLLKMQVGYLSSYQNPKIVAALTDSMKLKANDDYVKKFIDTSISNSFNCNKNFGGNSGANELNKQLQSHFIDCLNVEPTYLLSIINSSFIQNTKDKADPLPFQSTTDSLFFAMHLGEKIFSHSDKRKLIEMYVEHLKVFVKQAPIKLKEQYNGATRFNYYGFNYTCSLTFLKAFQNLNYPIYETDLKPVKELFSILPCNKDGLVDGQESLIAYMEKSALENMHSLVIKNEPVPTTRSSSKI